MVGNNKIWYGLGIDNKSLQADAEKSKKIIGDIGRKASQEGQQMDETYKRLSQSIGMVFSSAMITAFITKLATVRGEFQQLEVAFTTMLGSKARADELMAKTIDFAAKTPFDLQGVANGTKQLLAYGSQAETVTEELAMLGNIASGLSMPLGDLVYLYGTTRTQGQLLTMDLRQFMGRGIPLAKELAKQFGVTEQEVKKLVSAGKVGFKEVEIAMKSMTSEGAMFYNLMEEQSKTITGKMSNLGDGISQMFNKIGEANQDAMSGGLDMAIDLVDNYEKVGKAITDLIVAYGLYRATLITLAVAQRTSTSLAVYDIATKQVNTAMTIAHTRALIAQRVAQVGVNLAAMANPYVILTLAITGLLYEIYKHVTALSEEEKAQERLNNRIEERKELIAQETEKINSLIRVIKDEVSTITEKQLALEKLQKIKPEMFSNMDIEAIKTANLIDLNTQLNAEYEKGTMLSNKKTIEENKAEIKRQEKIQADATKNTKESGGMVQINAAQAIIDRLKADNVALGETIRLQEKASKQAEYDIQNDKQKIAIKKAENAELEQKLKMLGKEPKTGKDLNSELRENINKQILQNNKEISIAQGKIDEANNIPLQSRVTLLAEIKKVEKEINDLREKSKTGINATEKQKLEDAGKELASLKSELESMTGVKETKAKTEKNPYDKVKVALENARKVEDAEYESQVKILETQKDSAEKSLKLLELEGKRKLAVLERQRVDTISAMEKDAKEDKKENKSHDAGAWKKKIEEYNKFLESQKTQQEEVNKKATEEFIKSQLEQYLTYTEKVAKLEEEAKMKIADFEAIATKEGDVNKYAEKIKLVRQELEKALFELDQTSNKTVVGKLFADNTHTTIEAMKEIVVEAEKMYSALAGKEGTSPETLKAIREQIDKLKISIKETDNGFKEMGEGIFDILSGDYPTGGITESLSKIENGLNTVMKAGRFLSDSLMSLGESFGNKDMQNVAQTMDDVMSVASATMDGAKLGAQIGGSIGAAAGAAIGLATSLAKVFSAKHDRKQEREIQKLQVQVDTLKKTYDTLGKAIDKAYSSDASQLIQQQDENLRRQKTLLEQQIKAEEGKKKADKNKINGWKDAIYQIDQQLLLTEDKQIEAINGKSVQSAISDFASAYVNAWSAGEDKAKAMKDVVKNMVKSAITELVKSRLKGEVEAFSKYLASAMEDGILSVAEQNVLDSLEMAINDKMKGLSSTLDAYVLDDKVNEEGVNREATTKGFANMSQDSADELNGRFATLQAHTYSITESIKTLQLNSMIQLKHLAGIETNTASLVRLENIENNIVRMKLSIDDINDKGIIIRR